uniref:DYW domain-containing protein n=1 Tax=Kalanchoe fedtschenkoi TaxID=63787 RepID=A0A7N0TEK2_KALFE
MSAVAQTISACPPLHRHHNHHHGQLLTALATSTSLPQLKQVHAQILKAGLDRSTSLIFKLILSSISSLDYALSVFIHAPVVECKVGSKLLREISRSGEPGKAVLVYGKMRREGCVDRFCFPPVLKALARVEGLREGMEVHGVAVKLGLESDAFVQTALVGLYGACGRVLDARLVFDKMCHRDVVAWSIMIESYCQNGHYDDSLMLFEEIKSSSVKPDGMIVSNILSACGRSKNLAFGEAVHEFIDSSNMMADPYVPSNLVTMYASCGSMDLAQKLYDGLSVKHIVASTAMVSGYSKLGQVDAARSIFDQMVEKDLVCWSAMIAGYAESDWPHKALDVFNEMQTLGMKPDEVTMLSVISACARLGALERAKWVHSYVNKNNHGGALSVNNALIDMYAKCGSLDKAKDVFDKMPRRNVISWTSMINSFAIHGDARSALNCFNQMQAEKVKPNAITFVGVLYACSHAGLVGEGKKYFVLMTDEFNITPKQEHYGCMVDLYGRANLLREALEVVETMPLAPNIVVWGSLMAACRVHGEFELGEFAAQRVLDLEPDHDGAHVLLSNLCAKSRRWGDVGKARSLMRSQGIVKEKGYSRVELGDQIHEFLTADRKHRHTAEIYEKLNEIVSKLKLNGYAPDSCSVLLDLDEEEKKEVVLWHSEKLALSYALINRDRDSEIRIIKNLRICDDCHTFMKMVSKVYHVEIIVRDRSRFHHYRCGVCSCGDYW